MNIKAKILVWGICIMILGLFLETPVAINFGAGLSLTAIVLCLFNSPEEFEE